MERKRILVYDDEIYGHHMEYIHHIHERAAVEKDKEFLFVCPERFSELKAALAWTGAENISFDFLSEAEYSAIRSSYRRSFVRSARALNARVKEFCPDEIFLIILEQVVPFDLLYVRGNAKVSGIIYGIMPLMERGWSWRQKLLRRLEYRWLLRKDRYGSLYILNSRKYADWFNAYCRTGKFRYLTDPVMPFPSSHVEPEHEPHAARVFLHPGAMRSGKGTLTILDAIALLPVDLARRFIFAGRIMDDIKEEFYRKYELLKGRGDIEVIDAFVGYDRLSSLFRECDAVLAPYRPSVQSSGIAGHAALFRKPLIVFEDGFLGDLVRENHLGVTVGGDSPEALAHALIDFECPPDYDPAAYVRSHSAEEFTRQIFENF